MENNLYDYILEDLKRYCQFEEDLLSDSKLTFVVFSMEPFGFVMPAQKFSNKSIHLRKQFYKAEHALEQYKLLCRTAFEWSPEQDAPAFFLSALDEKWEELSLWCKIVHSLEELKTLLDEYMPEYPIGCENSRIGMGSHNLYSIKLWIDFDTNSNSRYKKLYKGGS